MATAIQMITRAMRLIGATGQDENPTASEAADCLTALNSLLDSLALRKIAIHYERVDQLSLVAGTGDYTIGTGGTFSIPRPNAVHNSFVRIGNTDYPVRVIDRSQYDSIAVKDTTGTPYALYYEKSYPLGTIKLYYEPDENMTLHLASDAPLQSFATLTDALSLPPGNERMLVYNLACEVAPEFHLAVPERVQRIADESLDAIMGANITPLYASLPEMPGNGFEGSSDIASIYG